MENLKKTPYTVIEEMPSRSNPNRGYQIRMGKDGVIYCTCPAWGFSIKNHPTRTCKHLQVWAMQKAA
ncbi:MAG: hypothetical protein KCHDKBKB_01024 [Elusimicrobia bacterium]|nr:hypothetical protein [Elusimicrobiota bacterium]